MFACCFQRAALLIALLVAASYHVQRFPEVPRLTAKQEEVRRMLTLARSHIATCSLNPQPLCPTCLLQQTPVYCSSLHRCPALQALQAVTDLANDPQLHLEWDLEPGDIQVGRATICT